MHPSSDSNAADAKPVDPMRGPDFWRADALPLRFTRRASGCLGHITRSAMTISIMLGDLVDRTWRSWLAYWIPCRRPRPLISLNDTTEQIKAWLAGATRD